MKVIFLDFDGVINSHEWYQTRMDRVDIEEIRAQYPFYELDLDLIENLNFIISETGAKVVISSSWRTGRSIEILQDILDKVGFKGEVIDKTVNLGSSKNYGYNIPRGCEIDHWLLSKGFYRNYISKDRQRKQLEKSEIKNYVILDDTADMLLQQKEHFVNTSWKDGLTIDLARKAVRILNSTPGDLYF